MSNDMPGGCPLPNYEDIVGSQSLSEIIRKLRFNLDAGAPTVLSPSMARVVLGMLDKKQSQASVADQLIELITIANRLGLYDAADLIARFVAQK